MNKQDLGLIFSHPLFTSNDIFAAVFITEIADSVELLTGQEISSRPPAPKTNEEIRILRKMVIEDKQHLDLETTQLKSEIQLREHKIQDLLT